MSKPKKYCDGLDCAICNEKEPCIYRRANDLEEQLSAKKKECNQLKVELKAEKNKLFLPTCYEQLYKEAKEMNNDIAKKCFDLEKENKQLKAKIKEVNDFLTDIASYVSYNGEPPTNLNEVRICIKDICKVNQFLDKNAKLYRQALQEIKEIVKPYSNIQYNDCVIVNVFEDLDKIIKKISEVENGV